MEELVSVLQEIRDELILVNEKLDNIQGHGLFDSIAAVCDKLDEIKGNGLFSSLSDVCDKLDTIDTSVSMID